MNMNFVLGKHAEQDDPGYFIYRNIDGKSPFMFSAFEVHQDFIDLLDLDVSVEPEFKKATPGRFRIVDLGAIVDAVHALLIEPLEHAHIHDVGYNRALNEALEILEKAGATE